MRKYVWVTFFLVCGCTSMEHAAIVSPSESLYYKADRLYEDRAYDDAIKLYEQFLEAKPRSDLAVPAQLNLGMSHYYLEDYPRAYQTLKAIDLKDVNVKIFIEKVLMTCKTKAGDEIQALETARLDTSAGQAADGQIEIRVVDAFLDDFGSLNLQGTVNRAASVTVDGKPAVLNRDNVFSASTDWKRGKSIAIEAAADGSRGTVDYFPDSEPPREPEGLRALNTTSNSVEIEWDDNREADMRGYRIFYRRQSGALKEVPGIVKDNRYEVIGFLAGSTVDFYLRAVDKMNNESEDSDILQVTLP